MENGLVVKHNDLIEAKYKLSLVEQKIILYTVSQLNRDEDNFKLIKVKISDIAELIGDEVHRYTEFRKIANDLMDKKVTLSNRPNLDMRWLASSEYIGEGIIELEFSEKLIPYLLQLKQRFTRYEIKNILSMKSSYSVRIYELMKQYENIGKREFELIEFKTCLGLKSDEYSRIYDFERFVLKVAKEEINRDTDLIIDYEKKKKGRKIIGFIFSINPKDIEKQVYVEFLNEFYDIKEMQSKMGLSEEKLSPKQVMNIYEKAIERIGNEDINPFEYIRLNYLNIKEKARNKYSYLLKALENDYAVAIAQISIDHYL